MGVCDVILYVWNIRAIKYRKSLLLETLDGYQYVVLRYKFVTSSLQVRYKFVTSSLQVRVQHSYLYHVVMVCPRKYYVTIAKVNLTINE